jgi:hypothetical protein
MDGRPQGLIGAHSEARSALGVKSGGAHESMVVEIGSRRKASAVLSRSRMPAGRWPGREERRMGSRLASEPVFEAGSEASGQRDGLG